MENDPILFYSGDFNCFSNLSSYAVEMGGVLFPTSEHAYQYEKFSDPTIQLQILNARSGYDAKMIANAHAESARQDWNEVKLSVMEDILRAKLQQHSHIKKKLLETGDKEIIEASKDDAFWGWGADHKGSNNHGKIWMKLRSEIL